MEKTLQQIAKNYHDNNMIIFPVKSLNNEIFLPVVGYEGLYEISNLGRVKRLSYYQKNPMSDTLCLHKEKILKLYTDKDGYFYTGFCKNNVKKTFRISRIVSQSFIENPNKLPCVNHIDNNRQNNNSKNLEWTTWKGNINHKVQQGRQTKGIYVNTNKLTEKEIVEIRNTPIVDGRKHRNEKDKIDLLYMAKKYNVTPGNIGSIIKNKTWKHL